MVYKPTGQWGEVSDSHVGVDDPRELYELLSDAADDSLPEILMSLELPPPLTRSERVSGRVMAMGRGGFRPDHELLARIENESVVEELRRFQSINAREYESGTVSGSIARVSVVDVEEAVFPTAQTECVVSQWDLGEKSTKAPGSSIPGVHDWTSRQVDEGEWWKHTSVMPEYGEGGEPCIDGAVISDVDLSILHEKLTAESETKIDLDALAGTDLRGAWVHLSDDKITKILRFRPSVGGIGVDWARIPRAQEYADVSYGGLLTRLSVVGLAEIEKASESRKLEIAILNSLLESVDLERQWERLNDRRQHLILKKHTSGISEMEKLEYDALQDLAERRMNQISPLDLDRFEDIDSYLRRAGLDAPGL